MIKALGLASALALSVAGARAQTSVDSSGTTAQGVNQIAARIGGAASLSATTSSSAVSISADAAAYDSLTVTNGGAAGAYFGLGGSATTGTPDIYLAPGATVCLSTATTPGAFASQLSAITASGSTTLYVAQATTCLPTAASAGLANILGPASPGAAAANSGLVAGVYNSTTPSVGNGQQAPLQLDSAGRLIVATNSSAFSNGQTLVTAVAPATPAAATAKGSSGKLFLIQACNANTSAAWLKLFNTASVTLGTTSAVQNIMIPASGCTPPIVSNYGIYFSSAISYAVTGGVSLTDNTSITASTVTVNFSYQ